MMAVKAYLDTSSKALKYLLPSSRRSKDLNSSQESLFSQGMPQGLSNASLTDLRECDDGTKEGSPSNNSSSGSRSGSPDKPLSASDIPTAPESEEGDPSFIDSVVDNGSGFEKKPLLAEDNYEMSSSSQGIRERSFERSLDNILDKCSEKSLDLNLSVDSWNSSMQEGGKSPDQQSGSSGTKTSKSEKKKYRWYNIMSTTYKSRSEDFKKMFKDVPNDERLIVDYSCALQKDILVQGRMYISQNWICFFAKIFNWETMHVIPCREITAITKEKTARVIPNAIQITTEKERFFFTSFGARDKTYMMLFRIWQNALLDQEQVTDSEAAPLTAENNLTASTEDTDAFVSDEVFNSSCAAPVPQSEEKRGLPVIPPVFLNSSDDSEGEYFCDCHDHLEKLYLDEVFNINIDGVFECLFTDSAFFRNFVESRKTFDLNLPNWEEAPDENGNKVRHISYTLMLNHSIGPKTSPSTEKQICYAMSRPGRIYHVDCECCNGGIPYADSFFVVLRYCLTRVCPTKCRVIVTGDLRYKKHVMMMFKSMIDKSAVNGLTDYCRQLSVHLRHEAQRQEAIAVGHQLNVPKKKLRRKRGRSHANALEGGPASRPERQASTPPSPSKALFREDKLLEMNAHTLVRIITVVLVLLMLFNAVLFYKLWSLESYASSLFGVPSQESVDNLAKFPRTQEEWTQLLQQQKDLHKNEISKWEEVLSASINIIEQMKISLISLQKSLRASTRVSDDS